VSPRPIRSRPLPRTLSIMDGGKEFARLSTLADVRDFLKHVPKATRDKETWQHVEAELNKAAAGGDTKQVSIALEIVLSLEGAEYQAK
jgi:hypothetical protein